MSTEWHLECKKCGVAIGYIGRRGDKVNRPYIFIDLVPASKIIIELAELQKRFAATQDSEWRIELVQDYYRPEAGTSDLSYILNGCDHQFEPKSEWGKWAPARYYPKGSPQSNEFEVEAGPVCSGRGWLAHVLGE